MLEMKLGNCLLHGDWWSFCFVLFRRSLTYIWEQFVLLQLFEMLTSPQKTLAETPRIISGQTSGQPMAHSSWHITHYREDWRGPTGLAGITSALLWPVQGRVFCRAILETAQGADFISQMGSRSCYQEKGEGIPRNSWAFYPESLTWSLASMGLTSRHSSLLWLLLWALLCVKGEQSEWGKK